jgi:hypothetical protein
MALEAELRELQQQMQAGSRPSYSSSFMVHATVLLHTCTCTHPRLPAPRTAPGSWSDELQTT